MNNILSITVDATLKHGMRAKRCAAAYTKMRRNEQDLEHYIINVYPNFEILRIMNIYTILTQLSSMLRLQSSNGMPRAHLTSIN